MQMEYMRYSQHKNADMFSFRRTTDFSYRPDRETCNTISASQSITILIRRTRYFVHNYIIYTVLWELYVLLFWTAPFTELGVSDRFPDPS
jgi:hypothetical protein